MNESERERGSNEVVGSTPSLPISLLSCDIGIKHMALCHYTEDKYRVFFFTFESPSV